MTGRELLHYLQEFDESEFAYLLDVPITVSEPRQWTKEVELEDVQLEAKNVCLYINLDGI